MNIEKCEFIYKQHVQEEGLYPTLGIKMKFRDSDDFLGTYIGVPDDCSEEFLNLSKQYLFNFLLDELIRWSVERNKWYIKIWRKIKNKYKGWYDSRDTKKFFCWKIKKVE